MLRHTDGREGERIAARRAELGKSQRSLSFEGCGYAYISRVEAGDRQPSMQVLEELAKRLSTTAHWLAWGTPDPRDAALKVAARVVLAARQIDGSSSLDDVERLRASFDDLEQRLVDLDVLDDQVSGQARALLP